MTNRRFKIAVLPGDGIGPEVVEEAVRVLRRIESILDGAEFELEEYTAGVAAYLSEGDPLPESTFAACRDADAVLLGAMGLPDVRYPDGKEMTPQIDLREKLDLYAGVRPIRLYHESNTPLKGYGAGEIDFVLVRESTEGLFSARGMAHDCDTEAVEDRMRITRGGAERICRAAFEIAQQRGRDRLVTLVDKANVLPSMVFFRRVFDEVAEQYPDCRVERVYVDAAALYLVRCPERFDVIVTENMFGDILSDLAAGLVGGMGMAPSADIGETTAVFQPAHGSAPDIAGRGLANPVATILSLAMLLDWLDHVECRRGAKLIRTAVEQVMSDPAKRTADMGGSLSTTSMTDAVIDAIGAGGELPTAGE